MELQCYAPNAALRTHTLPFEAVNPFTSSHAREAHKPVEWREDTNGHYKCNINVKQPASFQIKLRGEMQYAVVSSQGCQCVVFVPENMVSARREAIEREGAEVVVVRGNYDDAIAQVQNLYLINSTS